MNQDYNDFVEKFKTKLTTDDCYTPDDVYETVKRYALSICPTGELRGKRVLRPFYPGGDYRAEDYEGAVVIDNPPFSIEREIVKFYQERDIPFFLFAPFNTNPGFNIPGVTYIACGASVVYHNGARVSTSFVTNFFQDCDPVPAMITSPDLLRELRVDRSKGTRSYNEYTATPANLAVLCRAGMHVEVYTDDDFSLIYPYQVIGTPSRKDHEGRGIYGTGICFEGDSLAIWKQLRKEASK